MKSLTHTYLFIGVYTTCYIYADMRIEKSGNYHEIGRLYYSPLHLEIKDKSDKYKAAHERMKDDLAALSKVDQVEISATGQTAKVTHQTIQP